MSQITLPLDIDSLEIIAQTTDKTGNIILDVASKHDHSTCHQCGKPVEKSELTCFNLFLDTLKKYQRCIANYFKRRKSSGFVEGLNNKIKVAKRRCYGLAKPSTIFQRLFLDLQGYEYYA